jgi:hypothetical protein
MYLAEEIRIYVYILLYIQGMYIQGFTHVNHSLRAPLRHLGRGDPHPGTIYHAACAKFSHTVTRTVQLQNCVRRSTLSRLQNHPYVGGVPGPRNYNHFLC